MTHASASPSSSALPSSPVARRDFLQASAAFGAGLLASSPAGVLRAVEGANEKKLVVGVMGLGRGLGHVAALLKIQNVEIGYVCDVDAKRLDGGVKRVVDAGGTAPKAVGDFRRILDDKGVDAVFIATCNHWHAPATILACSAGKHVYVEKPGSHNAAEGEMSVAAARKNKRVVQMGNQRRTWPAIREAVDKLREGVIGRVTYARCVYNSLRPTIGRGEVMAPPPQLNYDLWQGPAPERPYKSNLIPYNWHWHWHYGGGEMANNGIHSLDVARWGLGVEYPTRVTFLGGRYAYDDDQETPDTGSATFHFGDKGITWEVSSCHPRRGEGLAMVTFYGDKGILQITDPGYRILDMQGKELDKKSGEGGDIAHMSNFLNCIRTGEKPNSEIEEGQKSTLLCHLANIGYRTGRVINFDPATRKILNDPDAMKLWGREYRPGWEPKV